MPLPLPANPDVQQLAYFLVAIPDDPVYRQAAKGWFGELGNARSWGLEGVVPESYVAAQSWLRAISETFRLAEMSFPDVLLSYVDQVEAKLDALKAAIETSLYCCGPNQTFSPPPGGFTAADPVPQAVVDAGYATSTSDHAGYDAYKCMVAHLLINNFQAKLLDMAPLATATGALLMFLLAIFAATSGLAGVVIFGFYIAVQEMIGLVDLIKDLGAVGLADLAGEMETNRDELVCAILAGDGIQGSIDSYKAKVDELWTGVEASTIKSLNVDHMFQHFLAAAYGDVNVAAELAAAGYDTADYNCNCSADIYGTFTFTGGLEGFEVSGQAAYDATCQAINFGHGNPDGTCTALTADLVAVANAGFIVGHTYRWRAFSFDEGQTGPGPVAYTAWLGTAGGLVAIHSGYINAGPARCPDTHFEKDVTGLATFLYTVNFEMIRMGNPGGNGRARWDNIHFEFDDLGVL